jgi:hypothetical protein
MIAIIVSERSIWLGVVLQNLLVILLNTIFLVVLELSWKLRPKPVQCDYYGEAVSSALAVNKVK